MIDNAELCLTIGDDYMAIPLSETQMSVIANILGLSIDMSTNGIWCRSDESLKNLLNMKTNPLQLKEIKQ